MTPVDQEHRRLELLKRLGELDSQSVEQLQSITALAARLSDAPLATIGLVYQDTIRYRATTGAPEQMLPWAQTFCAQAFASGSAMLVPDATLDHRFRELELVTGEAGIRFYAATPLTTTDGVPLGTLCILDRRPREDLGALGEDGLATLGRIVADHLETRSLLNEAGELRKLQAEQEQILDAFSRTSLSGYSLADANGIIQRISGFTSHIMGYAPEELTGLEVTAMVPEALKEAVRAQHAAMIHDGKPRSGVWKIEPRQGRSRYMHISGERLFSADGDAMSFSSLTDITDDYLRTRLRNERSRLLEKLARKHSVSTVLGELLSDLPRYAGNSVGVVVEPEDDRAEILSAPKLTPHQQDLLTRLLHTPDSPPHAMRRRDWLTATPDLQQSTTYAGGDIASEAGWHAMLWFPLRYPDGSQRGASGILRHAVQSFEDQEVELLADVVALCSTLLETGKLLEQMHYQAHHDILTGLANRRLLKERIGRALSESRGGAPQLAVFMLDLDNFKMVNDSLGHDAGDALLSDVATRLLECVRREDTVSRLGGDEFVVLASDVDHAGAGRLARKIMSALESPATIGNQTITVRPSIGIALSGEDGAAADTLLRAADAAMYAAKAAGRNCYRFHGAQLDRPITTRFQLQQELYRHETRAQIITETEPRLDSNGDLVAVELMSTWHHPLHGRIGADELLELATETGQIRVMEERMVEDMMRVVPQWQAQYPGVIFSTRVADITLSDAGFQERLEYYLSMINLPPQRFEADITHAVTSRDYVLIKQIHELQERLPGLRLSVCNLGEASVPLLELPGLGVSAGKLSPRWLEALTSEAPQTRTHAQAIVTHIQQLGDQLGMTIVAEGVETREHWDAVRAIGVRQGQGPFFGRKRADSESAAAISRP